MPSIKTLAVLAALLANANAFWRLECDGSVGLARLDPLMAHGVASQHVHSIKGGSAFSTTATADQLLASNCTSCGVAEDMSAYWSPAMYFMHDNGTVQVVPEKPPHKSYYLLNTGLTYDGKPQTVEAFPNGFQMIAGNSLNRNSTLPPADPVYDLGPWPAETQTQRAQRAIGFNCLHYAAGNDERTLMRNSMPTKEFMDATCTDGIRLELQFPSCWNGKLDEGPTHNQHVAYPDGVITGNCPEGYDRRLVSLFYETIVATDMFKGVSGKFVLANGDPTGFGYHGDFISAWKSNALANAVQACNQQDSSGLMRDCTAFTFTQDSATCKIQSPLPASIATEDVRGPMDGLANGLPIWYGPEPAPMPAKPGAADPPSVPPAAAPVVSSASNNGGDTAQNIVPTAPLPSVSAPLGSHAAMPAIGSINEKVAVHHDGAEAAVKEDKAAIKAAAAGHNRGPAGTPFGEKDAIGAPPPRRPMTTPAPAVSEAAAPSPGLPPDEKILTTSYYKTGNQAFAEVVVQKDVVVVKNVVKHIKRHAHHHRHVR